MQTQNYVYYMHFLVLKESEQKCARALFVTLLKQICAKKIHHQRLKCPRARAMKENIFEYLCAKFGRS